jgi:hypothetical protein
MRLNGGSSRKCRRINKIMAESWLGQRSAWLKCGVICGGVGGMASGVANQLRIDGCLAAMAAAVSAIGEESLYLAIAPQYEEKAAQQMQYES